MRGQTIISVKTKKARQMACAEANAMRNLESAVEQQCGISRFNPYYAERLDADKLKAYERKNEEARRLLEYCGIQC